MDKILGLEEIKARCAGYRASGKKIVFTNGCFDILHAGHVKYLTRASGFGDILILGLNSDRSVKTIKGEKRPVIGQDHRACVLSALFCVDHVVLFDEPDPRRLIEAVCPDILVKGADWGESEILGGDFVKQHGGRIERVDLEPGISTTRIIERIGELYYGR
nr:D-glycero-beta-D-manno-heptose 1-phosphate adenylyltransferase [Desulfobacula sp.]